MYISKMYAKHHKIAKYLHYSNFGQVFSSLNYKIFNVDS